MHAHAGEKVRESARVCECAGRKGEREREIRSMWMDGEQQLLPLLCVGVCVCPCPFTHAMCTPHHRHTPQHTTPSRPIARRRKPDKMPHVTRASEAL
mmetsp:Transcript_22060/g.54173  ORF Transcript_22060/g.54173 Transcript_22060/m.54173 type:complete len:97 (+) Transcript_22060:259-549(+)